MHLNLHLLRVFYTVATEGSFSAAARALHVSQPAVSKGVSELERQLDTVLLERTSRKPSQGLGLTDAGEALQAHARAIFALERAAVNELQQRSGLKRGHLVIGASTTVAGYWLPDYLRMFSRQWPEIVLRVVVANTQSITDDLFDCLLDLALVEGPVHKRGIASLPWRHERLVIIGPAGFGPAADSATQLPAPPDEASRSLTISLSAGELTDCTWLVREPGSGTREVTFELLARHGVNLHHSIEVGSNEGIARAVASGLGVAMLPFAVVEALLLLGRVVEIKVPGMTGLSRPLFRLERLDRPASPAVQAFLDVLAHHD